MRIRTKLVGAFLLVALLVPALGGLAVRQVNSINSDVQSLSHGAIPTLFNVHELERAQEDQQAAVLRYYISGREEDRTRYEERARDFDQQLERLTAASARLGGEDEREIAALARQLADERSKFAGAALQIISARATVDQALTDLRRRSDDISIELSYILRRLTPAERRPTDGSGIPEPVRRQNSELVVSIEGMLRYINLAHSQAAAYAVRQDPPLKVQFEENSEVFTEWLQAGMAAGNTNDQAILARVRTKYGEFEASARSMLRSADFAAEARTAFTAASASIIALLDQMAASAAANTTQAQRSAESTAASSSGVMAMLTIIAFAVAGALGVWLAAGLTRPITHLRDVADRVSRGDFANADIQVATQDEIGDLARSFRRMVASLRILMPREDEEQIPIGRR